MSRVLGNLGRSRQDRLLGVALTITAVGFAACGGDNGDPASTTASPRVESGSPTSGGAEDEPILILTRMNIPTGKILDGSTIGDSPFCPAGTVKDKHGNPGIGLVDRTITCSDGTLRVGFDPQMPVGDTQSGPWRIISGTGAYEGWEGLGDTKMTYDPSDNRKHPSRGRERYTGTVTR